MSGRACITYCAHIRVFTHPTYIDITEICLCPWRVFPFRFRASKHNCVTQGFPFDVPQIHRSHPSSVKRALRHFQGWRELNGSLRIEVGTLLFLPRTRNRENRGFRIPFRRLVRRTESLRSSKQIGETSLNFVNY